MNGRAWPRMTAVLLLAAASGFTHGAPGGDAGTPPDWSGWWAFDGEPPSATLALAPPPLRPADLARLRAARIDPAADPDPLRYCRPPEFVGTSGSIPASLEILFTPGRVTILNEEGLVRRIYTDGRALPEAPEPSGAGTSVGRWDGDTLIVETAGVHPTAKFPDRSPGAIPVGRGFRITERIALKSTGILEFHVTVVAPEILTTPYRRVIPFRRSPQSAAHEASACSDADRAIDLLSGQQRFDATPPADLPPPPAGR